MGKASVNGAQFGALLNMKFHDPDYMTRKHVAAELDIGESTFSEYVRMDRNFPPDLTPDLVSATGDLEYLRFFTRPLGLGIHRLPKGQCRPGTSLLGGMGEAMERFGELAQRVACSTSPDSEGGEEITPAELQEIAHAYEECVEKMAAVVASARAQAGVRDGGIL